MVLLTGALSVAGASPDPDIVDSSGRDYHLEQSQSVVAAPSTAARPTRPALSQIVRGDMFVPMLGFVTGGSVFYSSAGVWGPAQVASGVSSS
jgi:hypothetical protein